jgi:hypothetical protein
MNVLASLGLSAIWLMAEPRAGQARALSLTEGVLRAALHHGSEEVLEWRTSCPTVGLRPDAYLYQTDQVWASRFLATRLSLEAGLTIGKTLALRGDRRPVSASVQRLFPPANREAYSHRIPQSR